LGNALGNIMPRYIGKICEQHPELNGERRNGNCPACQRERRYNWAKVNPVGHRARIKRYRINHRDRFIAGAHARAATRRARKRAATGEDSENTRREFAILSREAREFRMVIDHIVPLAACRVCGAKGDHAPWNWQLLTPAENLYKGIRCQRCWRPSD
jgi:hypothetical protein